MPSVVSLSAGAKSELHTGRLQPESVGLTLGSASTVPRGQQVPWPLGLSLARASAEAVLCNHEVCLSS